VRPASPNAALGDETGRAPAKNINQHQRMKTVAIGRVIGHEVHRPALTWLER
jgi:hypothetical protein